MNANATISINKARQLRWRRIPHAKLPTANPIAARIRTNSTRSFTRKPNPIKGKTATKSGIARQWMAHATGRHAAHATERHAPVVSTNSRLIFFLNCISLENRERGAIIEIIVPILQFQKLSLYKNFTFRPGSGMTALMRDRCSRYTVLKRFSISKTTIFSSCHHEKLR